jgi:hypothetical protein
MYTCDLEKNQSGKEILKWRKIEGNDEDSDRSSDGELNNSSGQYTKRGEEKDIIDITGDRSMNISLDDLFPPEKISADYKPKIKIEEKVENGNNSNNKKKLKMIDEDDNNINEFYNKDHEMNTSRITNKTQEITIFDISLKSDK